MKKVTIYHENIHQEIFFTIDGINIPKSSPQQIPEINIAAPNIPAIPLYLGSTQLKTIIFNNIKCIIQV